MFLGFIIIWGEIVVHVLNIDILLGFTGGASGKETACQCRRCERRKFDPWPGKIPWRRAWQPTPVFLPGESPWTGEPGGLQFTGLRSVRHDWSNLAQHRYFVVLTALSVICKDNDTYIQKFPEFYLKWEVVKESDVTWMLAVIIYWLNFKDFQWSKK